MTALTLADFAPHVGAQFPMRVEEERSLALRLEEVRSLGATACPGGRAESFALLFSSAESGFVPQGTYALHHPSLGPIDVFLVPVGLSRESRMQYEAIFN